MNIDATSHSSHSIDDLFSLLLEQSSRIERLESTMVPLPPAQDREAIGRPPIVRDHAVLHPGRSAVISPAEAFAQLAPITARYATLPIVDGFNWADCAVQLPKGQWYLVVFRSLRREAVDDLELEMHDYGAYIESQRRAIGLLFYFRGNYNERRECLSFCIWNSREEAVWAAQLPLHRRAMAMTNEKYEWYALERFNLRKVSGQSGIIFEPISGSA